MRLRLQGQAGTEPAGGICPSLERREMSGTGVRVNRLGIVYIRRARRGWIRVVEEADKRVLRIG